MVDMKYDVFISCKSEDYPIAQKVCDFLVEQGFSVFYAEKSIPYVGNADYKKTVDQAIDSSRNLIVVASNPSYFDSPWVSYEWNLFANEKLSGRKDGNLMTIIEDHIDIIDLPIGIRNYQSFFFSQYKTRIIPFISSTCPTSVPKTSETPPVQNISHDRKIFSTSVKWWMIIAVVSYVIISFVGLRIVFPVVRKGQMDPVVIEYHNLTDTLKTEIVIEDKPNEKLYDSSDNERQHSKPSVSIDGSNAVFSVNGVAFEMVLVNGGSFVMGLQPLQFDNIALENEKPAHEVRLDGYYIGKYEVTQAQWKAVMGDNPSMNPSGSNYPVEMVSWNDCKRFVNELNELFDGITDLKFDIPTEAQWEFAAIGGEKSKHYRYCGSDDINDVGWFDMNSDGRTHKAGGKRPNELGIYDMSGNVSEWCEDYYGRYPAEPQTNPVGPAEGSKRVVRGSCYFNDADDSRNTIRSSSSMGYMSDNIGLRLAAKVNINKLL